MGAQIAAITETQAVESILDAAETGRGHWTITANLDHIRRYHTDPVAKVLMDDADLVVADGMPVIWASRVAGEPLPERVSGSNMIWSLCEAASARAQSIFLLGGPAEVAERAAIVLEDRYPRLDIVGTAYPPVGFENDRHALEQIVGEVVQVKPDIVFVALGFPKQDLLIRLLRRSLPQASFLGVGISLSYVTGDLGRAPDWMCRVGLEWAHRLCQEPTGRLLRRYLIDGLPFAARLMAWSALHRVRLGTKTREDIDEAGPVGAAAEIANSVAEITHAAPAIANSVAEITHAAAEITNPATEITQAAAETTNPATEITHAAAETTNPATEITHAAAEITNPATEITHAAAKITHAAEIADPVASS
jgi:N-acetylglucosaminyldiphosphoundecaprenol N-acetyl-beta-D-mannosaminyltransferase